MSITVAELPQFVIDDIVQYAAPCHDFDPTVDESGSSAAAKRLTWVCVDLALVAPRWAAAIQRSETVPPLLAEACALRLPRSIRHGGFMTMSELRRRVGARGALKPLPAALLLPIEDCARADCPRYCDALASAELMEPLVRPGSEQLRQRRQFFCARCDKVVPIRATRRLEATEVQPHAIVKTRARVQFLRRPRNRPTYGIAVIDCDGVSAAAMLRVLRTIMFDGTLVSPDTTGNRWEYPDASSACFTPSFRLTAGSCAHQYEFYPVTVDAEEGHACAIPEDHPARTRHPTMQLLFYGVIVSLTPRLVASDAAKRMTEAARRDLVSQAWRQPVLQMIAPVAADNDEDTAEIPPVGGADCRPLPVDGNGALRILRVIESGCGSESDSDSGGATSADTPGGRSRSPLSTDGDSYDSYDCSS